MSGILRRDYIRANVWGKISEFLNSKDDAMVFTREEIETLNTDFAWNQTAEQRAKEEKKRNGALHFSSGKLRLDLLAPEFIMDLNAYVASNSEPYGGKYPLRNWEAGGSFQDFNNSCKRHQLAWEIGQDIDPDSGFNHMLGLACDAMFLYTWQCRGIGTDDRMVNQKLIEKLNAEKGMFFRRPK